METLSFDVTQAWQSIDAYFTINHDRLSDPDIIIRLIIQAFLFLLSF